MFPVHPGGGGNGGIALADSGVENDGSSSSLNARVCLLADPRQPTVCGFSGAGELTVTLGSAMATTAPDGAFTIGKPASTSAVWNVSGTGMQTSVMSLSDGNSIPALSITTYSDMLNAMNAVASAQTGAIIAQLTKSGVAVSGATVVSTPAPDSLVYYDGPSVTEWGVDATGPFGIVWISSLTAGTASLLVDTGGTQTNVTGIPVTAGAITFVFAEIP